MKSPSTSLVDGHEFIPVPLVFSTERYQDAFAEKNNKTLAQTLEHHRYGKFRPAVMERYPEALDEPLGRFLLGLKQAGDPFYRRFLNKYGDIEYAVFAIPASDVQMLKGVYAYFAADALKYVGRCRDTMKKRVNQGYGKIHPKNCYIDGQATNCHLNARIAAASEEVSLWLCPLTDDEDIITTERRLIQKHNPPWNIQR